MIIWQDLKGLVIETARHELADQVLSTVGEHLLFENGVEIKKEIALPTLPKNWRYEVNQARDLGQSSNNMDTLDTEVS